MKKKNKKKIKKKNKHQFECNLFVPWPHDPFKTAQVLSEDPYLPAHPRSTTRVLATGCPIIHAAHGEDTDQSARLT